MATAAVDTDAMLREMPVSVRARLPDLEGVAEQQVERGADRAAPPGPGVQAWRTWPRISASPITAESRPDGDREEVRGRLLVVGDVEVVGEVLGRQEGQLGEEVAHVGVGTVELLGDHVDLGAVARGQHDRLADVLAAGDVVERLAQARLVDGHPLEQVERHGAVVQPDDDDRHASRRSLASARLPSRMSSSIPESRACCQSRPSVGRPSRRSRSRSLGQQVEQHQRTRGRAPPRSGAAATTAMAGLRPLVEKVTSERAPADPGRQDERCSGRGRRPR